MQELIGDEIIDETDRYTDNAQTARVNAAGLAEKLPPNLRTLLSLGMFMPRVHPGRARARLPDSAFSDDAPLGGAPQRSGSRTSVASGSVSGTNLSRTSVATLAATRSLSMRSNRSVPGEEAVEEAYRKVEAHLAADAAVADAVGVLRDAVAAPQQLRRTASAARAGSMFASRAGRAKRPQALAAAGARQPEEVPDV